MKPRPRPRPIEILVAEDNPADVRILQETLREAEVPNRLHSVRDGVELLEFLRRQGAHAEAVRPHLVLLDLNMPRKSGLEALLEIKKDPALQSIPVIVLTSSNAEHDVAAAYDGHANCYITKPMDLEDFEAVVQEIESFWLRVAQLPPAEGAA